MTALKPRSFGTILISHFNNSHFVICLFSFIQSLQLPFRHRIFRRCFPFHPWRSFLHGIKAPISVSVSLPRSTHCLPFCIVINACDRMSNNLRCFSCGIFFSSQFLNICLTTNYRPIIFGIFREKFHSRNHSQRDWKKEIGTNENIDWFKQEWSIIELFIRSGILQGHITHYRNKWDAVTSIILLYIIVVEIQIRVCTFIILCTLR